MTKNFNPSVSNLDIVLLMYLKYMMFKKNDSIKNDYTYIVKKKISKEVF